LRWRLLGWKVRLDIGPHKVFDPVAVGDQAAEARRAGRVYGRPPTGNKGPIDGCRALEQRSREKDRQKRRAAKPCGKRRCYIAARLPPGGPRHRPHRDAERGLPHRVSTLVERHCG
jgi:hypothetical protein